MPDIFLHFVFKRWLSHGKPDPRPQAEPQQPPAPPKQR